MNDIHNIKYRIGPLPIDVYNPVFEAVTRTEPVRPHPFRRYTSQVSGGIGLLELTIPVGEDYTHDLRLEVLRERIAGSGHAVILTACDVDINA